MNFTSRELSEKLVKLGCVSESGFYWICRCLVGCDEPTWMSYPSQGRNFWNVTKSVPAFTLCDFVGSEKAEENAKKAFGFKIIEGCPSCPGPSYEDPDENPAWIYHSIRMAASKDALKYLEENLREGV